MQGAPVMLPNGMVMARPGLPQIMQVPAAGAAAFPGMLHPGIRHQMLAMQRAQARAGGAPPEATHVPTAGYVANNVSGYTPANSGTSVGPQQVVGQPIPVLANGVVNAVVSAASSAASVQQHSQPMFHVAGGVPGLSSMAGIAGMPGLAPAMPAMAGMPAALAGPGVQQSMAAGLMMAPSPAGAPAAAAVAQQQLALQQQLQLARLPGMQQQAAAYFPAGAAALPVQNVALAQTLKRPLAADPMAAAAVMDKRLRLA